MKQKRFMYEKPTMQVVELKSRGILMASGVEKENYGDPTTSTWGDDEE